MDNGRRLFLQVLAAAILPFQVSAAGVMRMAEACIKMGRHWSLPNQYDWRKASERKIREHLMLTHGHEPDRKKLERFTWNELLDLHDTHHKAGGGRFNRKGIDITIPDYAPGSVIHPWGVK